MGNKIRVLSPQTVNQIAAGEVIENPSSVVKELIENAIDAGASQLTIEIQGGGFQWIKICDDGCGMSPDDAVLCLKRHATSKIVDAQDLFSLTTMGFRGEALASIAAISHLSLFTAQEGAPAVNVEVEGGTITHVGPAPRPKGTTIEIRSLFYNVPARKKFQKSPAASSAEITKTLTQLSLAHPEVGFTLVMQNRTQFSLPPSPEKDFPVVLRRRAEALLGPDFLASCRPFDLREKGYWGKGLIADPLYSRHNRSGQYLFVNRRPVVCHPVAYAVRDAFGTRLGTDRHPVYLLHLTIGPDLVDVNVHPQKKEIRLREEGVLKYALHSAVNATLCSPLEAPPERDFAAPFAFDFPVPPVFREDAPLVFREDEAPPQPVLPIEHPLRLIGLFGPWLLVDAASLPAALLSEREREKPGILWIHLPAAEARIRFDALVRNAEKTPASQGLLIPADVSFSKAEAQLLSVHLDTVQKLGIQIRECGDRAFLVEGIPPFMNEDDIYPILVDIIGALQEHDPSPLHKLSALLSRRARLGTFYAPEEARRIALLLLQSEDPHHCPKGKPTIVHIRENEIESWFTSKSHRPLAP